MQLNPLSEKYLKASLDQDSWNEAALVFGTKDSNLSSCGSSQWFLTRRLTLSFLSSFLHEIFEPFESNGLLHRIEGLERCAVTQEAFPR